MLKSFTIGAASLAVASLLVGQTKSGADEASRQSISQHGITWKFSRAHRVGQFANGDWWVVGPVTVTSVSPAPEDGRNGSMANPKPGRCQGYDSRATSYDASLCVKFPYEMPVDTSLVSTVSLTAKNRHQTFLESAAILTCLKSPPPADSFRPSYCGTAKKLYRAGSLRSDVLPSFKLMGSAPLLRNIERKFERPWIDHQMGWGCRSIHPCENMPAYGKDMSTDVGDAALTLLLDERRLGDKERLLIRFVQLGIDLHGITAAGGSWEPDGGHGSGRKFPILFAGLMLDEPDMLKIGTSVMFAEDGQTFHVAETAPGVINGGHGGYSVSDVGLPEWGIRHATRPQMDDRAWTAKYRQCCTASSWSGFVLAARVLGLKKHWKHDALFDYMDRYMEVTAPGGSNAGWRSTSPFAEQMWDRYRREY